MIKTTKKCNNCKAVKNVSDFYQVTKRGKKVPHSKCKQCCVELAKRKRDNPTLKRVCQQMISHMKSRKASHKKVSVTTQDLMTLWEEQKGICAYSGFEMTLKSGPLKVSCDRIDSSKGYSLDNLCLCAYIINTMKHDSDLEDFVEYCKAVVTTMKVDVYQDNK